MRLLLLLAAGLLAPVCCCSKRCDVRTFGAKGDGRTVDTQAIRAAITDKQCSHVVVPEGQFVTGTIRLKSNLVLEIQSGATLLGAADGHYEPVTNDPAANVCVDSAWARRMASGIDGACQDFGHGHWNDALITGSNLTNVTLRGGGAIDGNGHLHESCIAGNALPPAASHIDPRGPHYTTGNASLNPGCKLLALVGITDLSVTGLTFRNGGWFTFLFTDVEYVHLSDLTLQPARDGIDLVGCRHVLAERLQVHGGNDDAFALKSDWSVGRRIDSYNITLRDSSLSSNGCNCLQFGSETSGNFYDIHFDNITCTQSGKAGIGISTNDGGNITNVDYRDITLVGSALPLSLSTGARAWQRRPPPWRVGKISNISLVNVRAINTTWSRTPWYWPHCQHCNLTSTVDTVHPSSLPSSCNLSSSDPTSCYMTLSNSDAQVFNVTMRNVSIEMSGGGRKASAAAMANFSGPDYSGQHASPSYGLFLRNLYNSSISGLTLSFAERDDRPPLILLEKSDGVAFDVGLRSSKDILLPRHLKTCEYPYTECTSTSPLEADGGSTSSRSQIAVVESSSPVRTREVIDSGVVRVQIPQRECDPRAHGALGDGRTDDTLAIQAAIDECASALGGTVALTCKSTQKNCTFASFPLKLTGNNTEFHIDESATLRFSSARNDSRWQGVPAAILGSNVHDLAITGSGTIDGNGSLWWDQCAGYSLNSSGWSVCGRPGLFTLNPVRNVLISGPRFLNSPCHNIVIRQSMHVEIGHVRVEAPPSYDQMEQSNNTDGIDVDGEFLYMHDSFISVGDDLVVLGSNHTLVERMEFGSGRGASIAPGCNDDQRAHVTNITVRDSTFSRSTRGVRIKTRANSTTGPGCHGSLSQVLYKNITMHDVNTTISMIMHYPCADVMPGPDCWPLFNSTSMIIDVSIEGLTAVRSGFKAVIDGPSFAIGDRDASLRLRVDDVHIHATHGSVCWGNVSVTGQDGAGQLCT